MALKIAMNSTLTDIVSAGNPIVTQHPTTGSTVEKQLWLFNDVNTKTYQTVVVDPSDVTATDESIWVSLAPNNGGVPGVYLAGGAALTLPNIGATGVETFWAKVAVPNGVFSDSTNKTDIQLTVTAKEFAV